MASPPGISARHFDRVARGYDKHAAVQSEAAKRLLERLDGLRFQPRTILEIGCADGRQCRALKQRFPGARVIGLDFSPGMLDQARSGRGWWKKRYELIRAGGARLPLADGCMDLVYANLSLGWIPEPEQALAEMRRVLRPDGLALVSLFGPDTLGEWRAELASHATLGVFVSDVQQLGANLTRAGFAEPVLDTDWITTLHGDAAALLDDLAGAALLSDPDSCREELIEALRQRRERLPDSSGQFQTTWEIVSASSWAPQPGQPIRSADGEEVSIPPGSIGVRRRD